jgi:hypothetical protein
VEIPSSKKASLLLSTVSVAYTNMKTHERDSLSGAAEIKLSRVNDEIEKSLNRGVLADVVALVASEQNKVATKYLDQGDLVKCREVLKQNGDFLTLNAALCPTDTRLEELSTSNRFQQVQLKDVTSNSEPAANAYRKGERASSFGIDQQQTSKGAGRGNPSSDPKSSAGTKP